MYRLLAIIFFSATLATVNGVSGHNLHSRDDCNVNQVTHCCQGMTTVDDPRALQVLHDLGFPVDPSQAVVVGKNCTEHDSTNNCVASPVCCSGNLNNRTAFDCSPVNQNGAEHN